MERERPENVEISAKALQTLTIPGYFARFYEILPQCRSNREAWERLEEERLENGLSERYTSYESFRNGKHYHNAGRLVRINTTGEE